MEKVAAAPAYKERGYALVCGVLQEKEIADLIETTLSEADATHERGGAIFANRSAILLPAIAALAKNDRVVSLARQTLNRDVFAVRTIIFDKVEGANWKVPWHQDLTITVRERHDVEGYGPWSSKEDQPHVRPPTSILENMISIRLHLDDCGIDNGPLRAIEGSHRFGRLKESRVEELVSQGQSIDLTCKKSDAILMSPLLIYASSPAKSPAHRRVIHIDYASCELTEPIEWANRIS